MAKTIDLMTYLPWMVGGVAAYEGYFIATNTEPPIRPDPLYNFIKGLFYKPPTVTPQSQSPSNCSVVCPTGQHPNTACTCIQDTVTTAPTTSPQTPPTTPTPTPSITLQGSYSNQLTFRFPTQSLMWPSTSTNVIVDNHESAYPNTQVDITQITLYADGLAFQMKPYAGPLWSLVINLKPGVHSLKAIAKYKNGWSTSSPQITFSVT